MISLLLRNLFFTILQPGIVAGLVPWLILKNQDKVILKIPGSMPEYAGILLFSSGIVVVLTCVTRFALHGKGTLSPLDPTKKLVISGLYKYSRNPMYVGVMLILAGETLYYQSAYLLVYTIIILIAFHSFIVFREEPRLKNDFGEEYNSYVKQVRRWA